MTECRKYSNQKNTIKVSVLMPVYNHEAYVAQAIESVLMQKTNFRYELIIGEDCSTDQSRKIVRQYQEKYPDIIKVIYQSKNRGGYSNSKMVRQLAKGKYWAACEGDDYWTDCHKLQKQVDFLDANTQYSAVYHNVICVDKKGRPCRRKSINKYPIKPQKEYTFETVKSEKLVGQTASLLCRNVYNVIDKKMFDACRCNGDSKICVVMACVGKIYYMEDAMACHRVVLDQGTSWSAKAYNSNMNLYLYESYIRLCKLIYKSFCKNFYDKAYADSLKQASFGCFLNKTTPKNFWIWILISIQYMKDSIRYSKLESKNRSKSNKKCTV